MPRIFVTKANGEREEFKKEKIVRTCLRAGASREIAERIASYIESIAYDGIPTREIYHAILRELDKVERKAARLYRLREAISELSPRAFELFVKEIFENLGYECEHSVIALGEILDHELDVVARKNGETKIIECKHHVNFHRLCNVHIVLYFWAVLQDLKAGYKIGKNNLSFNKAAIVTNTKFTQRAVKYALAKGIELIGWRYPRESGLEKLVEKAKVLPITILNVGKSLLQKLMERDIATVNRASASALRALGFREREIREVERERTLCMGKE